MARKKQSPFEDVIEITSKLPWWVGVLLAIISYFLLHAYAVQEIVNPASSQNLNQAMTNGLFRTLAQFGQYVLPSAFFLGSGISAYKQFARQKLHQNVAGSSSKNALNDMSWQQFEILVGEYFRQNGYKVEEIGGGGADGGTDLILYKNGEKHFVQCKQWKTYKVGVKPVRELLGVMVGSAAAGGMVVTSGEFTRDAMVFANKNNIQLIDGTELHKMIKSAPQTTISKPLQKEPLCPKCGSSMVKRTAKKGNKVGQQFWGCSQFPSCRSTLPIAQEVTMDSYT